MTRDPQVSLQAADVWLVTVTGQSIELRRAFISLDEASDFASKKLGEFNHLYCAGNEVHFGGARVKIEPLRLGLYGDGS